MLLYWGRGLAPFWVKEWLLNFLWLYFWGPLIVSKFQSVLNHSKLSIAAVIFFSLWVTVSRWIVIQITEESCTAVCFCLFFFSVFSSSKSWNKWDKVTIHIVILHRENFEEKIYILYAPFHNRFLGHCDIHFTFNKSNRHWSTETLYITYFPACWNILLFKSFNHL